jgi:hypothetical protein
MTEIEIEIGIILEIKTGIGPILELEGQITNSILGIEIGILGSSYSWSDSDRCDFRFIILFQPNNYCKHKIKTFDVLNLLKEHIFFSNFTHCEIWAC